MKQTQQRLIAAAGLLVAAVAVFLIARSLGDDQEGPNAAQGTPAPTEEVLDPFFPEQANALAEVTAVTIRQPATDDVLTMEQVSGLDAAEGEQAAPGLSLDWTITEAPEGADTGLGTDTARIQSAVFTLPTLTPTRALTDVEGSFSDFGLQPPQYEVTFQTDFGPTFDLSIGNPTPTGQGYYVQVGDADTIYVVGSAILDPLVGLMENPPFVPSPDAEPTEEG